MSSPSSLARLWRKNLPLQVRMGYGWVRRRLVAHPLWSSDEFKRYQQWLLETQWWSRERLEGLQLEHLRPLVKHAYENVPYYRRVFEEHHLRPEDISALGDLHKLPLLTKDDVRDNLEALAARNIDRDRLLLVTTSGFTGRPLALYHDAQTAVRRELAFQMRQWRWAGYQFGDRMVTLRGSPMTGPGARRAWWDFNTDANELVLSVMDMSEENMFWYLDKIREFRPRFINAVPSGLEILARFMRRNGIDGVTPCAMFCESETLLPAQRELIESHFGCKIFAGYGHTERAVDAVECEQHEGYHVSMEYGILELIGSNGELITQPGTLGVVVATGFDTYCMPFIRYVTGDLARYAARDCSCNRQSTLIGELSGRVEDFLVSKSGYLVPVCVVETGHTPVWAKIRELKFFQERAGELTVRIARAPAYSESEISREFLEHVRRTLDEREFSISIVFVDHIPRSGRGKLGLLEQKLPVRLEDLDQVRRDSFGSPAAPRDVALRTEE